ncbi:BCL-6 corepressor [Armadillidium vulgare]|nr:BCL-6 corepressor [Armadillidium vulgare]
MENSDTDDENSPQSRIIDSNKRKKGGVLKLKIVKSNTNLSSSDSDKDEPTKKQKLISDSDEGFAPSKIKSLKSKILDSESDLESHLETPIDIPQKAVDEELCTTVDTKVEQNENEKLTYLSDKELLFNNSEDSVLIKLNKIRLDELNREDVQEMKLWKNTASTEMKKLLEELPETKWRHSWRKPQFGSDEFKKGWQAEVKKFKIEVARIPSRLVSTPSPPSNITTQGEKSSCGNQKKSKDNLKKGKQKSVPLKNTRSKAGIVKTSLSEIDKSAFKVAARPEISNVMERFFEKVLGEGPPSVESCKKFPAFEPFRPSSRSPTGLTPTPSLALSLIASDDSDRDSIASLRTDLPASDSVPVAPRRRSIANTLFKRLHKKNKENKLDLQWLNKSRGIMKSTNKPCLLPTPGLSLKDTDSKTPTNYDQLRLSTFFRKDSVSRYRETFDDIVFKNGINEFIPVLVPSRTRNKSKALLDAATIKAVFGADSSSIVLPSKQTSNNSTKSKITNSNKKYLQPDVKRKDFKEITFSNNSHTQSPIPSSISQSSTPVHFLFNDNDDDDSEIRSERSETTVQELVIMQGIRKSRKKLRKFRKFRSGFDYIRKKKKTKTEEELLQTVKKRMPVRKRMIWPEENKDIANEIKGWVINKGLGETVLHKAARLQYHDVVIYCLESSDFNVNAKDNAGYTPLHEACNRGHLDIAQALCAHHAHVNASGFGGMRPLHEAIENGHIELARLLLAYGADPSLSTYGGQSCLALASDPQTERFVVEYLADLKAKKEQLWHFLGPSKIFDLTEQGCDVFATTPQSREMKLLTFPSSVEESSHKDIKIKEENSPDIKIKEEPGKEIKIKEELCSSEQNSDKTQNEDELLLPKITFEYSEREIPTTYMVVDRDGTYFLMRDLLERLSMTRNELIVAVGSVETLHLSAEDCDKKVKCLVLGSIPPSRKRESRGSVTFVKYSDTIRELLGIEVCVLKYSELKIICMRFDVENPDSKNSSLPFIILITFLSYVGLM